MAGAIHRKAMGSGDPEGIEVQVGADPPYNGDKQFPSFSVLPVAYVFQAGAQR